MAGIVFELGLLFALLIANGVFAMAEISVVSSRQARLQILADQGKAGAKAALGLMLQPGKFLSTVQVGITLVSTLAGASSGAYLIAQLTPVLAKVPFLGVWAGTISTLLIVGCITFLSVIIGELVPKRLAMSAPERTASLLSRPMIALSRVASPIVRFLDKTSALLARLLGMGQPVEPSVSEEEVRAMIRQGALTGVFKKSEQHMMEGVLELDDLTAADVMTPKNRIVWLDLDEDEAANWRKVAESGHSYLPAYRGVRDNVLGLLSVKTLWANQAHQSGASLESLLTPAVFVPDTMPCPKVIEEFRKHGRHLAVVIDEFGGVAGLVTLNDMMEPILGALPEQGQRTRPSARQQRDGTWIVDAIMDIEDLAALLGLTLPSEENEQGYYRTVGGFVLQRIGHVPAEGESFVFEGFAFEVIDMDRQRIDKIIVRGGPDAPASEVIAG